MTYILAGTIILAIEIGFLLWVRAERKKTQKEMEKSFVEHMSKTAPIEEQPLFQLSEFKGEVTEDWHYKTPIESKADKIEDREREIDWELMKEKKSFTLEDDKYVVGVDPYKDDKIKSKITIGKIVDGVMEYAVNKEKIEEERNAPSNIPEEAKQYPLIPDECMPPYEQLEDDKKTFYSKEKLEDSIEEFKEGAKQHFLVSETTEVTKEMLEDFKDPDIPIKEVQVGDVTWKEFKKEGELEKIEEKENNLKEGEDELLKLLIEYLKK